MIATINARHWSTAHQVAFALFLVALVIRGIVLVFTMEIGGDGPARAVWAYSWSSSPRILEPHIWLPGWVYLTGLATMLVGDPLNSGRMLNVILGSLTVPALYQLTRTIHGDKTAIISSTILTVLPAHVALSATTLGEIALIFGVVTGTMFVVLAAETTKRPRALYLLLCLMCMIVAITTRYEAWLLIPVLPAYYFWKTRRRIESAILLAGLSIFPMVWMGVSYFSLGELLPIYAAAIDVSNPTGFVRTGYLLIQRAQSILGWPLVICSAWGLWLVAKQVWSRALSIDESLFLVISLLIGLFTVKFALDRGFMMYSRYCLFAFVLFLPFAALPIVRHFTRPRALLLSMAIVILGSWVSVKLFPYNMYVTSKDRLGADVAALSDWLQGSNYKDDAVVMTPISGWAWYMYLFDPDVPLDGAFPNVSQKYMMIAYWVNDSKLQDFIKNQEPRILITRLNDRDAPDRARLESLLGYSLTNDSLIHTQNKLQVFQLASPVQPEPDK